jgi:hypothetical protein
VAELGVGVGATVGTTVGVGDGERVAVGVGNGGTGVGAWVGVFVGVGGGGGVEGVTVGTPVGVRVGVGRGLVGVGVGGIGVIVTVGVCVGMVNGSSSSSSTQNVRATLPRLLMSTLWNTRSLGFSWRIGTDILTHVLAGTLPKSIFGNLCFASSASTIPRRTPAGPPFTANVTAANLLGSTPTLPLCRLSDPRVFWAILIARDPA